MSAPVSIEQEELRGISRTVAEIHWLLLILVLLVLVFDGRRDAEAEAAVEAGMLFYTALVMGFRYANFYKRETRWKIALEALGMVVFLTWVLWFGGRLASPLLNAFLLPVITAALTLGKLATLALVGLIAACYLLLGAGDAPADLVSLRFAGAFAAQLAPVLLVGYITTMFSADIRFGLQRAKLMSETDNLTGLFNMRGFAIAADRLFGQAVRHGRPASVLMIDSDDLKTVNDRHGHEAGNRLLRALATTIVAELRATDVAARYGGDEFIVLLPETGTKGALEVAERIRSTIAARPVQCDGHAVAASVSIGVASYPEDGHSLDALAVHADRALYAAKQAGRNRAMPFRAAA